MTRQASLCSTHGCVNPEGIICRHCTIYGSDALRAETDGVRESIVSLANALEMEAQTVCSLKFQLAEAIKLLKPFGHSDFCKETTGCSKDHDILYKRDKAEMLLGNCRDIRDFLKPSQ